MTAAIAKMRGEFARSPQFLAADAAAKAEAQATLLRPIRTYPELRAAIDARRKMLSLTMADLDHRSGVQPGYSAKLICGLRHFGPMSLEVLLGALGVDLVLIERRRD